MPEQQPNERKRFVIENSRMHYAIPRHEAEQVVGEQLGFIPEATPEQTVAQAAQEETVKELIRCGVSRTKAVQLVSRFPLERVRRQISLLPFRKPRRPASLLIVAIEQDFEEPEGMQWQRNVST